MILKDLKQSISQMPTEKLLTFVAAVRQSRQTEKEVAPSSKGAAKRPTKKRENTSKKITSLLGALSETEITAIANQLAGDPEVIALLRNELANGEAEDVVETEEEVQ